MDAGGVAVATASKARNWVSPSCLARIAQCSVRIVWNAFGSAVDVGAVTAGSEHEGVAEGVEDTVYIYSYLRN